MAGVSTGRREVCKLIFELAAANHSFDFIADKLGITRVQLAHWIADYKPIKQAFRSGRGEYQLQSAKKAAQGAEA